MELSSELVSQFVNINNKDKKTKDETTVYGTYVKYNNKDYVRLDGSELLTPVSTTTNIMPDDRVAVLIKNHTATITGNITAPSARNKDVLIVGEKVENIVAGTVTTEQLKVEQARITQLEADKVTINTNLIAAFADIDRLKANKLDANVARITYATIDSLDAIRSTINNLNATYATIGSLDAVNARIDNLGVTYATITDLNAAKATISALDGDIADAAKTATNYLGLTTSGLVVGNMTSSTLGNNVLIDTDSVDIRNGSTTLASFGSDYLYLAKNSRNATINMCNGLATMYHASKYSYDSLFVIDTAVVEIIGASTPLCLTSTSSLENVSIQFANSSKVLGGIGIIGSWLRRYGSNMFDTYTILDSGNFHDVMDGGWVHCTYGDGFTRYSNSQANIQVRKIGKQVYLRGEAKPTTAVTPESETSTVLAVIPEGYRPSYRQNFVMQGSSAYRWLMSVYPGGNICISRYTNDTTMNKSISAGAWLCCYAQWTID